MNVDITAVRTFTLAADVVVVVYFVSTSKRALTAKGVICDNRHGIMHMQSLSRVLET